MGAWINQRPSALAEHEAWCGENKEDVIKLRCYLASCSPDKLREKLAQVLRNHEYHKAAIVRDVIAKKAG
jgi:protein-arginine kinase activator protein McsA